jgi:Vitamin K-dependent gamma-carboxylase
MLRFAYPLALRFRSAPVSSPLTRVARAFRLDEQATDAAGWAFNLAVFRIVYLTAGVLPLAIDTFQWTRHALPGLHPVLWQPVSFFRWVPLGVITDPGLGQALAAILVGLVVLGALGVRTRLVLGLATVVALYVLGLPQNLGKVHHHHNAVWFLAILAASPSGAVLSVDAFVRRRRGEDDRAPGGALAALRYVWALMAAIYLFPGLAKLVAAVVDGWASAEHQRLVLWNKWWQLEWYGSTIVPLIRTDGLPDSVLTAGALIVIVGEVGLGVAMMFRRTRPVALVLGLGFHLSTSLVLGIYFTWLIPAYVALVDWSWLVRRARGRGALAAASDQGRAWSRRSLHAVGIALLAGEVVVSSIHLLTVIPHRFLPLRQQVVPLLTSPHVQRFVWPFDPYPFFTTDGPAAVSTVEFLVVAADGQEQRVAPAVFEAAVGRPSGSQVLTRRIARLEDPIVQQAACRHLADTLWRHVSSEDRRDAQGLRVYVSRYRVAAPMPAPEARTLLLDIPASSLDTTRH